MITIAKNGNTKAYGIKHYIVDTEADIQNIDFSTSGMGTTVFVIDTSNQYMLNGSKELKKITSAYNPGGGEDSTTEVIYDGGDEDNG